MTILDISFYFFGVFVILLSCAVAFSQNLLRSGFALFFALFGMSGFYVMLGGDFVAVVQLMVYAGGVCVLLIFGTMLTGDLDKPETSNISFHGVLSFFGGVAFLTVLMMVFEKAEWPMLANTVHETTTKEIGKLLLTDYLLPFEVISFLLLAAMVGGLMIVMKDGEEE